MYFTVHYTEEGDRAVGLVHEFVGEYLDDEFPQMSEEARSGHLTLAVREYASTGGVLGFHGERVM